MGTQSSTPEIKGAKLGVEGVGGDGDDEFWDGEDGLWETVVEMENSEASEETGRSPLGWFCSKGWCDKRYANCVYMAYLRFCPKKREN